MVVMGAQVGSGAAVVLGHITTTLLVVTVVVKVENVRDKAVE